MFLTVFYVLNVNAVLTESNLRTFWLSFYNILQPEFADGDKYKSLADKIAKSSYDKMQHSPKEFIRIFLREKINQLDCDEDKKNKLLSPEGALETLIKSIQCEPRDRFASRVLAVS